MLADGYQMKMVQESTTTKGQNSQMMQPRTPKSLCDLESDSYFRHELENLVCCCMEIP